MIFAFVSVLLLGAVFVISRAGEKDGICNYSTTGEEVEHLDD